ncbi:unnamed protein product [Linum tenue]|uniref:F-box domain-containing protein n=1 Tax=Linum tenue TaxID=586396 RepID=A0AAV0JDG9_9ROSI|nr:unnamed protein product [Linum tenue]
MDRSPKQQRSISSDEPTLFPDEVLERVLALLESPKDRSAVSLVCKDWIRSVTLKGKPRFSDFNLVPDNWGANVRPWLLLFASEYPFLQELRLKRMRVTDESLEFLALNFPNFKALSLHSCDGFSTAGLAAVAAHCKNLTELDVQENGIEDTSGEWLGCFPDNFNTLEVLNFANLNTDVNPEVLEKLVSRCRSLKVLKVNRSISLDCLQRLLVAAPQLTELGAGSFSQELTTQQYVKLALAFGLCNKLSVLSGLWEATAVNLTAVYPNCSGLTFLNLSYAALQSQELASLLPRCPCLRRLWVLDSVGDKGLEAVGANCSLLEEIRVFPADPFDEDMANAVTESGIVAISQGCPKLHYILYFCRQMTNAAVATVVRNCPDFTHFRLCIMSPGQPDHTTNQPMDEAFGAVVKTCKKLKRLSISGLLTDLTFKYIGEYAKNMETLSVAFAGSSDLGMQYVMEGLFEAEEAGDSGLPVWQCGAALRFGEEEGSDDCKADKVYVYRTVAGPRRDAPPSVLTVSSL